MLIQSLLTANSAVSSPPRKFASDHRPPFVSPHDETVAIRLGQKQGDPSVITINCLDQRGLACDLSRILFEFGLCVVRGDLSTDGRWCFVIFWVTPMQDPHRPIKWAMLKKRLIAACPSNRAPLFLPLLSERKQEDVYVLQARCSDRAGLLNDLVQTLWELELIIHRVKVTTSPDGKAVNLFYINDIKNMLQNKKRQDDICCRIRSTLGDLSSFCELRLAGPEWGRLDCVNPPPSVTQDLLGEGLAEFKAELRSIGYHGAVSQEVSVTVDNSLSPGHTLLQISCKDRKGLLYDVMRTLKDTNLQIAYGRFSTTSKKFIEIDLFILQADGRKIVDPQMQETLCSRLEMEIVHPIRVLLVNRGPDTELLVATPVEASGCGRPQALFDVTLVLRALGICIFKADSGRYLIGDIQWEVYRFLLIDKPELKLTNSTNRSQIAARTRKALMG